MQRQAGQRAVAAVTRSSNAAGRRSIHSSRVARAEEHHGHAAAADATSAETNECE